MRPRRTTLVALAVAMLMIPAGRAGDAEDVKAEYLRHVANANEGKVDAFIAQHMPGHTAFGPGGDLLSRWDSLEAEKAARPDLAKPGAHPAGVNHVEVQVYNGNAAVVTAYRKSPVTLTDGTSRPGVRRVTSVWVKQNGKWLEVHDHMSTLITLGPAK